MSLMHPGPTASLKANMRNYSETVFWLVCLGRMVLKTIWGHCLHGGFLKKKKKNQRERDCNKEEKAPKRVLYIQTDLFLRYIDAL